MSARERQEFGRIVVIGGGCYGSWYTKQLMRAISRDAIAAREIVVVDRDASCQVAQLLGDVSVANAPVHLEVAEWSAYLAGWFGAGKDALRDDALVPSPLMPHLCLEWLMARAQSRWPARTVAVEPLPVAPPMPWQRAAPDARHYVSYATWTCPVNCIEPAKCPATRGERNWSLPPALREFAEAQSDAIDAALIFHCEHRAYGVGMIDAHRVAEADDWIAARPESAPIRALVGTVSHCHGALGLLTVS